LRGRGGGGERGGGEWPKSRGGEEDEELKAER
jgi:hypothetical protein